MKGGPCRKEWTVSVMRSLWYTKEKNSASRKIQKWVRREMLVEKKSRKACNIKILDEL
jgi:hypothetical protein